MSDARPDLKPESIEELISELHHARRYADEPAYRLELDRCILTAIAMKARIEELEVALTWIKKKATDKRNPSISFVADKVLRGEQFSPLRRDFADRIVEKLEGDAVAEAVEAEKEKSGSRIAELEAALERIDDWSKAYPLTVFPEPDFKKARALLEAGGMTIDAISASNMRHVVEGVGKIARAALKKGSDG